MKQLVTILNTPMKTVAATGIALLYMMAGSVGNAHAEQFFTSEAGLAPGVFLVADKRLMDPNFRRTVVLITEYGPEGTMGVIINRETDIPLSVALPQVEEVQESEETLFFGGPVSLNTLVMLIKSGGERLDREGTLNVFEDVYLSADPVIFQDIFSHKKTVEAVRSFAGYAGWAPGQLENELARGDWIVKKADSFSIFLKNPEYLWRDLSGDEDPRKWIMAPGYKLASVD